VRVFAEERHLGTWGRETRVELHVVGGLQRKPVESTDSWEVRLRELLGKRISREHGIRWARAGGRLRPVTAPVLGIGLMSGTSADGVDAALVEFSEDQLRLVAYAVMPYPDSIRARLFSLFCEDTESVDELSELNMLLGEEFARAALEVCRRAGFSPRDIHFIGSHGQTVRHLPPKRPGRPQGSTLQIGSPAVIAERTGISTVSDFRVRDMAVGGEGAPLIPYVDSFLFGQQGRHIAVQNVGGIANVTYLPADQDEPLIAFDTGPGNMVIDGVVNQLTGGREHFDCDGRRARAGRVDKDLLNHLMAHPFLERTPPKSTGREEFGAPFVSELLRLCRKNYPGLSLDGIVATVTRWTAASIAQALDRYLPRPVDEVIVGGGGSFNPALLEFLQAELPEGITLSRHSDHGIPDDAKEAVGFALLGRETLLGRPANVTSATGASRPVILGSITPGHEWDGTGFLPSS